DAADHRALHCQVIQQSERIVRELRYGQVESRAQVRSRMAAALQRDAAQPRRLGKYLGSLRLRRSQAVLPQHRQAVTFVDIVEPATVARVEAAPSHEAISSRTPRR